MGDNATVTRAVSLHIIALPPPPHKTQPRHVRARAPPELSPEARNPFCFSGVGMHGTMGAPPMAPPVTPREGVCAMVCADVDSDGASCNDATDAMKRGQ